ncbi:MAG TPA: hypothetical protein VGJ81_13880 [Thermoanaerobaculia bacterium]|jgi:hypothetical protein
MSINVQGNLNTPAGTPKLTPEAAIAQLRTIRDQLPEITPLTPQQRTTMRKRAQIPPDVLQASISVIGASDDVSSAIKQPPGDVNALQDEMNRWATVENELKALWNGVSGANLGRRYRLAVIAEQAYGIGTQLAKDPANVLLVPHVQEVKRLKKAANRKKPQQTTPQAPAPAPTPQPAPQQHLLDTPEVKA